MQQHHASAAGLLSVPTNQPNCNHNPIGSHTNQQQLNAPTKGSLHSTNAIGVHRNSNTSDRSNNNNNNNQSSDCNNSNNNLNLLVTKAEAVAMVAHSASRVDSVLPVATATLSVEQQNHHHSALSSVSFQPPVVWCSHSIGDDDVTTPFSVHATATSTDSVTDASFVPLPLTMIPPTTTTRGSSSSAAVAAAAHVSYIYNAHNGSTMCDSQGRPVTVERWLGTAPLRSDLLTRPGPGGRSLLYLSGAAVTRTLNDTFGFDGWHLIIVKTEQTVCIQQQKDEKKKGGTVGGGAWHVAYLSHVRVVHRASGTTKEDIGAGDAVDRTLPTAIAHAIKASITDAMKRAARHFGDKLGNALYSNGKFTLQKAPTTLTEALDRYDQEQQLRCGGTLSSMSISKNSHGTTTAQPPQQQQQQQRSMSIAVSGKALPPPPLSINAAAPPPQFNTAPTQSRVGAASNYCLPATLAVEATAKTTFASSVAPTTRPWTGSHDSSGQPPPNQHQQHKRQQYHSIPSLCHSTPSSMLSKGQQSLPSTMGSSSIPSTFPVHLHCTNPTPQVSHFWTNGTTLEMGQYEKQPAVAMTGHGGPIICAIQPEGQPRTHRESLSMPMPPPANAPHRLPPTNGERAAPLDKTVHQQPPLRDVLNLPPPLPVANAKPLPPRPITSCGRRKSYDMANSTATVAPASLHGSEITKKHKVNPYHTSTRESDAP